MIFWVFSVNSCYFMTGSFHIDELDAKIHLVLLRYVVMLYNPVFDSYSFLDSPYFCLGMN